MSEISKCPSCQRDVMVPAEFAGKRVQCPQCSATFLVAGAAPETPPPLAVRDAGPYRSPDEDDEDYYQDRFVRRDQGPHRASTILTLGILSLLICGPILGPMALVMGTTDFQEILAGRMDPSGEGTTNAGRICGIISTIYSIAAFVIVFIIIAGAGMGGR